jgi:hypothetical protein
VLDLRAVAGVDWHSLDRDEKAAWLAWWQMVREPEIARRR